MSAFITKGAQPTNWAPVDKREFQIVLNPQGADALCLAVESTYKIIGTDGREYGPVTLEELLAWINDGRVAPYSQIWRTDVACWRPANAWPELAFELGRLKPETPVETPPPTATGRTAGFWIRVLAFLVDQVPLMLAIFAVAKAVGMDLPHFTWPPSSEQIETFLKENPHYFTIVVVVSALYYIPLTAIFGATLGKLAFRLRVVRIDGSPVGWKEAVLRFLGMLVNNLAYYIGYLFVAFRRDRRGLHDLIGGTRVIHAGE